MRSGELANLIGVNSQTLLNWMERPQVSRFMSSGALGEANNAHRVYTESDALVLNSVNSLRTSGTDDWDEVAKILDGGWRDQEFPQNAIAKDNRLIPIPQAQQATEVAKFVAERDAALQQAAELKNQLEAEREARRQENEKNLTELRRLEREIGRLTGIIEVIKENKDNK